MIRSQVVFETYFNYYLCNTISWVLSLNNLKNSYYFHVALEEDEPQLFQSLDRKMEFRSGTDFWYSQSRRCHRPAFMWLHCQNEAELTHKINFFLDGNEIMFT